LEFEYAQTKLLKGKKIMTKKDYEVELTKDNISGAQDFIKNYDLKHLYQRRKYDHSLDKGTISHFG